MNNNKVQIYSKNRLILTILNYNLIKIDLKNTSKKTINTNTKILMFKIVKRAYINKDLKYQP